MAESHVVAGLVAKRAEMAGLIEHHKKETDRLRGELNHLDATIKLFAPEIDVRSLRAKRHRIRNRYFERGECQRMVLEVFRDAHGAALSSRQIGEALITRKGMTSSSQMIEQAQKNAIAVVRRLERAGVIQAVGQAGQGMTWTLALG